jgi:molybdopterin synthase sulfur carrier subunit
MMRCTILLFAQLMQEIGSNRLTIELPEGATALEALELLIAQHPSIAATRAGTAIAVNESYCAPSQKLHDGDTLALIPPVSGG